MKNFLLPVGKAGKQNQKLSFSWKIPFNLAAEPQSGEAECLTNSSVCTILKIARTFFAAFGGDTGPA